MDIVFGPVTINYLMVVVHYVRAGKQTAMDNVPKVWKRSRREMLERNRKVLSVEWKGTTVSGALYSLTSAISRRA